MTAGGVGSKGIRDPPTAVPGVQLSVLPTTVISGLSSQGFLEDRQPYEVLTVVHPESGSGVALTRSSQRTSPARPMGNAAPTVNGLAIFQQEAHLLRQASIAQQVDSGVHCPDPAQSTLCNDRALGRDGSGAVAQINN